MPSAGIVGLPNVGKSTLFNALARSRKAQAANYPFCTIEPNVGTVTVPDDRLDVLAKLSNTQKIIQAIIEFVDIAGLVKGANSGEGLGNQFLSHIREVDAIVQVVRCFESSDIHHVSGDVDPVRDIEVINTELILADLASAQKRLDRNQKSARTGDKVAQAENALLTKVLQHFDSGMPANTMSLTDEELRLMKSFFFLSSKPTIFACNVGESDLAALTDPESSELTTPTTPAGKHVVAVREYVKKHLNTEAVVISAQIESELIDLSREEAAEYLRDLGVKHSDASGVSSLIRAVYHLLGLRTYLTTGEKETRAWTIRAGDKAPAAAGVIHSDFERGFIAAEIVSYEDLTRLGSFAKAKEAGRLRLEGKEYVMHDGDVVDFRFNV